MRVVYLGNNVLGARVLRWLVERGWPPIGLVVHPDSRARGRQELIVASGLGPDRIREAGELSKPEGHAWLSALEPDWVISVLFGYVLGPALLAIPRRGAVNLHTALLPYNRGANPNVWSIVDRTPAGATLHYIDSGIDTGDVIAQRSVEILPTDTGASLYQKLEDAAFEMFCEAWPLLLTGRASRTRQANGGTFHRVRDVERIDRIDPERFMRAGELVDILRARTFPPYRGAYLDLGGRRIYIRVDLSEDPFE